MRITFIKISKFLLQLLITNILILGIFYYWFSDDISVLKNKQLLFGLIMLIIIFHLPQFIVLFNHYYYNKNTSMDYENDKLNIIDIEKKIEVNKNNIISWQLVGTASKSKKSSIKFTLIDDLFYIKVILKNEDSPIILTSLLYPKIDKLFEELFESFRIENKISSFPLIKKSI